MNCEQFRQAVGAEPGIENPGMVEHRQSCPACAAYEQQMRALDQLIGRALAVDLPSRPTVRGVVVPLTPAARLQAPSATTRRHRGRGWLALAASMVLGVAIGTALWVSYPRDSLAAEVIGHIKHEPKALVGTQPLAPEEVAKVLLAFGIRLKPDAGPVSFSMRCFWQGHWVPHLVVRTASGPVTVFVLPHRPVDAEQRFDVDGYAGVVLPAPVGSIAVIGRDVAGLPAIAQQVFQSIEWSAAPPPAA